MLEPTPSLAKLARPRLHRPLARPRLFDVLDSLYDRPLTWVCGPPGSGKTTLVASWLDARGTLALWYHADPGDRDPAAFFSYLTELAPVGRSSPARPLPVFGREHERDPAAFARLFFRRFFALLPAHTVLVIDNHHDASCHAFDSLLRDASTEVPESRQLIVISRAEAPPVLARAVLNQAMGRIDWDGLRLTAEESEALLGRQSEVPKGHAAELHRLCGGWVAGLVLLGMTTRALHSLDADAQGLALFEYFASEVLERIPVSDRALLLSTAAFPQFDTAMATRISGHPTAGAVLDRLTERQYFTERRIAGEPSFRYHDLFRDFLRAEARRTFGEPGWHSTLQRAAQILFDRGEADAAIECLRAAHDWDAVADAVTRHARTLLAQGRWRTVLGWLDEIPPDTFVANPWLQYWKGSARTGADPPGGRALLEQAFAAFGTRNDVAGQVTVCSAILNSYFTEWNISPSIDPWIERTEQLLSGTAVVPHEVREAALPALVQSMLDRTPTHPRIPDYGREVERSLAATVDPNIRLVKSAMLMYYLDEMGAFDRSDAAFDRVHADLLRDDALPALRSLCWHRRGYHCYFVGDFEAARVAQDNGIRIAREFGLLEIEFVIRMGQAMTLLAQGRCDEMPGVRTEMLRCLIPQVHLHAIGFQWIELWYSLVREDLAAANTVWDAFSRMPPAGIPIYTTYNHAVIWLMCLQGKAAAALDRIDSWRRQLTGLASDWKEFNFLAMEACARLFLEDGDAADASLRAMMALGRRHRYANLLTWIPQMAAQLCAAAWARGIETEYVRWLVDARGLTPPQPDLRDWPRPIEVLTLGTFEVLLKGQLAEFGQKAPRRPLALLKATIAAGAAGLSSERARAVLWPELDGDAASEALAAALHRLRKLLGDADTLRLSDGRLMVNEQRVWVDALAFERLADHADEQAQKQAIALYRGAFLPMDDGEAWSMTMRDRLRSKFATVIARRALALERGNRHDEAIEYYRSGIGAEPLTETLYQGLMRCYLAQGRRAEGASVYRQLRQTLSVILGISPSAQSESLGKALLAPD